MDAIKLNKTYKYYTNLFTQDPELLKVYNTVTFENLFNPEFLQAHSKWTSQDDILWRSGFGIMNLMEIENVDMDAWNEYVRANTEEVETWYDFGKLALIEWMKAKLEENKNSKN